MIFPSLIYLEDEVNHLVSQKSNFKVIHCWNVGFFFLKNFPLDISRVCIVWSTSSSSSYCSSSNEECNSSVSVGREIIMQWKIKNYGECLVKPCVPSEWCQALHPNWCGSHHPLLPATSQTLILIETFSESICLYYNHVNCKQQQ